MTVMLYRPGTQPNPQVWDWKVENLIVADDEAAPMIAKGWFRSPVEANAPKPSKPTPVAPAAEKDT